jgi:hypothetical protein
MGSPEILNSHVKPSVIDLSALVNFSGIIYAPYNEVFRLKHQLCLSILKEFGFGHRLMETRISVEVAELIHQARLLEGQSFDPNDMIHWCVLNVITSILVGQRFPYGHDTLKQRVRLHHDVEMSGN